MTMFELWRVRHRHGWSFVKARTKREQFQGAGIARIWSGERLKHNAHRGNLFRGQLRQRKETAGQANTIFAAGRKFYSQQLTGSVRRLPEDAGTILV
jgi:hypothetical protein